MYVKSLLCGSFNCEFTLNLSRNSFNNQAFMEKALGFKKNALVLENSVLKKNLAFAEILEFLWQF
jgi:hypothetical protein